MSESEKSTAHMFFFEGERPYECSVCSVRFSHKFALRAHLQCHDSQFSEKRRQSLLNASNMIKKTRTAANTSSQADPKQTNQTQVDRESIENNSANQSNVILEPVEISRPNISEAAGKTDCVDNDVECIVIDGDEKISNLNNDQDSEKMDHDSLERMMREILLEIVDGLDKEQPQTIEKSNQLNVASAMPIQALPIPIGPGFMNAGVGQNMVASGMSLQNILTQPQMIKAIPQLQPQNGQPQGQMIMIMPQGQLNQPIMLNNNALGNNSLGPIIINQQGFLQQQGMMPQQVFPIQQGNFMQQQQQQPRFFIGNPSMLSNNAFAAGNVIQQQPQLIGNLFQQPQNPQMINLNGIGNMNGSNIIQTPQGTIIMSPALNQLNLQQLQQQQQQKTDKVQPAAAVPSKPVQETQPTEKKDAKAPPVETKPLRRLAKRKSESMTQEPSSTSKVCFEAILLILRIEASF